MVARRAELSRLNDERNKKLIKACKDKGYKVDGYLWYCNKINQWLHIDEASPIDSDTLEVMENMQYVYGHLEQDLPSQRFKDGWYIMNLTTADSGANFSEVKWNLT